MLIAGMPSFYTDLSDLAKLRLENISFFLVGFLLCAFCIQLLWNYLGKDWTFLPRLSYAKAVGLVALWGTLFVLVLTMISGARELMTPGAWERKGFTHELVDQAKRDKMQARRQALESLRKALWKYAAEHDGQFPLEKSDPAIPAALGKLPDPSGFLYLYAGGKRTESDTPVAFEPDLFGERLVLFANGRIYPITSDEIARALPGEK